MVRCSYIFLGVFTAEIGIKVLARGLIFGRDTYLRRPAHWFDLVIVALRYNRPMQPIINSIVFIVCA